MHHTFSPKKFAVTFALTTGIFVLFHIVVWSFFSSKIFDQSPYYIGDLGRMSYQIDSLFPRLPSNTLAFKHIEHPKTSKTPIDLITIGDSFSNGMASGKNPYYQDYLATTLNINVLNIQNLDATFGYIDTIRYLHQSGWLHQIRPKAILIQSVVRESLNHVPSKNASRSIPSEQMDEALFKSKFTTEFPVPHWINTGNYKLPYYYLAYHFTERAKKEVYKFPLQNHFFSTKASDHLLIYHDDLNNINQFTEHTITALNQELNGLADELKKDNITLLFMPTVDKYDLYYNYITNKKQYPKNLFFPLLRKLPKQYVLIDTKKILSSLLKNNVKDVYYADDTHWSYISSDEIAHSRHFTFLNRQTQ